MTKENLLHIFKYNKKLGKIFWKNPPKCKAFLIGKEAGCYYFANRRKYRGTRTSRKFYLIHTLIYFIEKGVWVDMLDHIDGNGLNNKIENLRHVNNRQNLSNTYRHRAGKLVGTSFIRAKKKWMAHISYGNKTKNLGYFKTETEAHQRYLEALSEL